MKKYLGIITLSVATLFTSCSDQLDRFPVDSLVEETAYNTVEDLQFGLNGVIGSYSTNYIIGFNSIFTDNTQLGVDSGGQDRALHEQILNADTGGFSFGDAGVLWFNRYSVINDINRLFEAAATITPSDDDLDQYNNILAQNYAFRALAHYELLLYYGLDLTSDTALGVPYVDYVSEDATPARNTVGEVLIGVQNDLDQALSLFPAGTNDINFATPDFVTFLRARIALETGDNAGAIAAVNALIPNYPLANAAEYFDMFNEDASKTEVIFNYDNVQGADSGINFVWNFSGQGPKFEISNELFNAYSPDDIRRSVILDPVSDVAENVLVVGKYPINADTQAINDFKYMRISEAYLIRAEAYAKTTQFGLAAADVLAVQTARRGSPPPAISYGSLIEAIEGIIAERRLELAFEGHRYTDIKRVRSITGDGINRDISIDDCGGSIPCELPATSPKFILPLPTGELNGNPVIREQQAPGY
ncbi:RagB/SusD family nutrient uptake outer membrane protein [Psychroserpens damuponensis]|uniref:RagB/SusD family nutrient uptake outer membrane protein n=1 Tax=Psychroserpens damuponensis TaxID=943936 RepID=UPI00058D304C|nr:RagB/SusD family nutrient uptake outer membrane protein [Psychroserpens damuponensis]